MINAVEATDWKRLTDALVASEKLLQDTLDGNADAVARGIELAHDANTSIVQIKRKEYPAKVAEYTGEMVLVGINYDPNDPEGKKHTCVIERYSK